MLSGLDESRRHDASMVGTPEGHKAGGAALTSESLLTALCEVDFMIEQVASSNANGLKKRMMPTFLNRIMGTPLQVQKELMELLDHAIAAEVEKANAAGEAPSTGIRKIFGTPVE